MDYLAHGMDMQSIAAHIQHLARRRKSAIVSRAADSLIRNTHKYNCDNKSDEVTQQRTYSHFHSSHA